MPKTKWYKRLFSGPTPEQLANADCAFDVVKLIETKAKNEPEPTTHNFTDRGWGHDYTFTPIDKGMKGRMQGWGYGLKNGDYLLLQNGPKSTRYRIDSVEYYRDPSDMWKADVSFAPRSI